MNGLDRLPVRIGELLGLPIGDDRIDAIQAAVHAMDAELHTERHRTIAQQGLDHVIIEFSRAPSGSVRGAVEDELGSREGDARAEVEVIGVVHPCLEVHHDPVPGVEA